MECGAAVILRGLRGSLVLLALCWGSLAVAGSADMVVLIVNASTNYAALDSVEVRKLFLGLPVVRDGHTLHALRNASDPRLDEIFLQNIVSMSDTTYERRVLTLTMQQGRTPPPTFQDQRRLLAEVAADPDAVSFAWANDVAAIRTIKVMRVLWHE
jgi:hypothetical protein